MMNSGSIDLDTSKGDLKEISPGSTVVMGNRTDDKLEEIRRAYFMRVRRSSKNIGKLMNNLKESRSEYLSNMRIIRDKLINNLKEIPSEYLSPFLHRIQIMGIDLETVTLWDLEQWLEDVERIQKKGMKHRTWSEHLDDIKDKEVPGVEIQMWVAILATIKGDLYSLKVIPEYRPEWLEIMEMIKDDLKIFKKIPLCQRPKWLEIMEMIKEDLNRLKEIPLKYRPKWLEVIQMIKDMSKDDLNNPEEIPLEYPEWLEVLERRYWAAEIKDDLKNLEEIPLEYPEWLKIINELKNWPVHAAPASGVFSVKINCNSFARCTTCEVYGNIVIMDESANLYTIYCCDPDDAETITKDDNLLSLYMPAQCGASMTWTRMVITLYDRVDGSLIFDKGFWLDKVTKECDYDQAQTVTVDGQGGSVVVTYAVFSTAVMATVKTTIVKHDNNDGDGLPELHGRISARYINTYGKKFPGIMLSKEPSKNVVIVPAYSLLRIYVNLYYSRTNRPAVEGKADFLPSLFNESLVDIQADGFVIQVKVRWYHPYNVQRKCPKISDDQRVGLGSIVSLRRESFYHKYSDDLTFHKYSRKSHLINSQFKLTPIRHGFEVFEVFKLTIGHDYVSNGNLKICGRVTIIAGGWKCDLFNRDESNPETLTADRNTIPLEVPPICVDDECRGIEFNLRDDQGLEAIKGYLGWDHRWPGRFQTRWVDRHLCSVIKAEHCYAAVFYRMFQNALPAQVKVSFVSNNSVDVVEQHYVHGTITARYSVEDYCATEYERRYCQSLLFDKHKDKVVVTSGSTLPLMKSVVAVPTNDYLKIVVDLYVSPIDGSGSGSATPLDESLKGVAEFTIDQDTLSAEIKTKNYVITLSVEWNPPLRRSDIK